MGALQLALPAFALLQQLSLHSAPPPLVTQAGAPEPAVSAAADQPPSTTPAWRLDLVPYYWSASLAGDLTIDGQPIDLEDGGDGFFGDPALSGFLGYFEARRGPWSFVLAPFLVQADMEGEDGPSVDADLSIEAQLHEAFVAREFAAGWQWLVGARYQELDVEMDLSIGGTTTSLDATTVWTDPIVGLRYENRWGEAWSLNARADIGGFGVGSDFAWNVSALATYDFNKVFGAFLGYRALGLEFEERGGMERVAYDLTLYGPIIGVAFRL